LSRTLNLSGARFRQASDVDGIAKIGFEIWPGLCQTKLPEMGRATL
jgi:hypothetical protein